MVLSDSLSGSIYVKLEASLARSQSVGGVAGTDKLNVSYNQSFADGTGTNQADGWFSSTFTATTGAGITISLANADPLGAAGDDVPTETTEGKKLKAILIANNDTTNYVTVAPGTNGVINWIAGTAPTVRIPAGGFLAATFPAGLSAMADGASDELAIAANTASCSVTISVLYG